MVQSDIKTHHLKHLGSLGSEMLQNNTKTNNLQPLNDTLRGLLGRTPYDVQIALDAQETRLVLSNTLRMEFRPAGE